MSEGLLERVWEYREETLYPRLFGNIAQGIFVIPHEMFFNTFAQTDVDPRWLHNGVFEYAPKHDRSSWVYVTSGMSTPWEADEAKPGAVSGLGCEFVLESSTQGDWAIRRLWQLMAYQILLCHGHYPGREPLGVFDRLPLRGPIWDTESDIQSLMIAPGDPLIGTQICRVRTVEKIRIMHTADALTVTYADVHRNIGTYQDIALTKLVNIAQNGRGRSVLISAEENMRLTRRDRRVIAAGDLTDRQLVALREAKVPDQHADLDREI